MSIKPPVENSAASGPVADLEASKARHQPRLCVLERPKIRRVFALLSTTTRNCGDAHRRGDWHFKWCERLVGIAWHSRYQRLSASVIVTPFFSSCIKLLQTISETRSESENKKTAISKQFKKNQVMPVPLINSKANVLHPCSCSFFRCRHRRWQVKQKGAFQRSEINLRIETNSNSKANSQNSFRCFSFPSSRLPKGQVSKCFQVGQCSKMRRLRSLLPPAVPAESAVSNPILLRRTFHALFFGDHGEVVSSDFCTWSSHTNGWETWAQ